MGLPRHQQEEYTMGSVIDLVKIKALKEQIQSAEWVEYDLRASLSTDPFDQVVKSEWVSAAGHLRQLREELKRARRGQLAA